MENKTLKIIIFGATGHAGSGVLDMCLKHPKVEKITAISRRNTSVQHEKYAEIIHKDYLDYSSIEDQLKGFNTCLYCLGVSQTEVDEEQYNKITYDFTIAAAEALLKQNQDITFCFLSGQGADMNSKLLFGRVKAKTEEKLSTMPFKNLYHFRPSYIHNPDQKHKLFMANILRPLAPIMHRLFPKWIASAQQIGKAMISVSLQGSQKRILENMDIRNLSD